MSVIVGNLRLLRLPLTFVFTRLTTNNVHCQIRSLYAFVNRAHSTLNIRLICIYCLYSWLRSINFVNYNQRIIISSSASYSRTPLHGFRLIIFVASLICSSAFDFRASLNHSCTLSTAINITFESSHYSSRSETTFKIRNYSFVFINVCELPLNV